MSAAQAASVVQPTNLDTIDKGQQVRKTLEDDLQLGYGTDYGDVFSAVYKNGDTYTYTMKFHSNNDTVDDASLPDHEPIDLINKVKSHSGQNPGIAATGFNGVAGWSYKDVWYATAETRNNGNAFSINTSQNKNGNARLEWELNKDEFTWGGEPLTFFYQSTNAPGDKMVLSIDHEKPAHARAYAPVVSQGAVHAPTPGAFVGGFALLGGLGLVGYRRWRTAQS